MKKRWTKGENFDDRPTQCGLDVTCPSMQEGVVGLAVHFEQCFVQPLAVTAAMMKKAKYLRITLGFFQIQFASISDSCWSVEWCWKLGSAVTLLMKRIGMPRHFPRHGCFDAGPASGNPAVIT
jgi:hypothetical protein